MQGVEGGGGGGGGVGGEIPLQGFKESSKIDDCQNVGTALSRTLSSTGPRNHFPVSVS